MIGIIVLAVLTLFFLVMAGFSVKTWPWLNVVAIVFVFGAAVAYAGMLSLVTKTNNHWRAKVNKETERFDRITMEVEVEKFGDPASLRSPNSIYHLTNRLKRASIGKGSVYRGCSPGAFADGTIDVSFPATGSEAADAQNAVEESLVLYAFTEAPYAGLDQMPDKYIGEFIVESVNGRDVTLKTSLIVDMEELNSAEGKSWALYDLLPADSNYFLLQAIRDTYIDTDTGELVPPNLFDIYSRTTLTTNYDFILSEARDKFLPPERLGYTDPNDPAYIDLLNKYVLDGMPVSYINTKEGLDSFVPDIEEQFIQVRLLKPKTTAFDANSGATDNRVEASIDFDVRGRAVNESLKVGGDSKGNVSLKANTEIDVDYFTAIKGYEDSISGTATDPWIPLDKSEQGDAEQIDIIFKRKLNDYGEQFHQLTIQERLLKSQIEEAKKNNESLAVSKSNLESEVTFRETKLGLLGDDNANLKSDLEYVQTMLKDETAKRDEKLKRIAAADKRIRELTAEIAAMEEAWINEADRRTEAVTGGF